MAFDDIIAAITAQTDAQITQARTNHAANIKQLKADTTTAKKELEESVQQKKATKQAALLHKATSHSEVLTKNTELQTKQELLDELFEQVLTHLAQLPAADTKKVLEHYLKQVPKKGVIRPSKTHQALLKKLVTKHELGPTIDAAGGFIFESDTVEQDCTYEHIVQAEIRVQAEVDASYALFA